MASNANWSTRFPVYQIDFQAVSSGKMIASSKRKVRWRFGFPNQQALSAGRTGVDCRGEEHDIVIIWSVTSGKRQVYFDGTEIHFSSSRAGIFQYSWSAKGNHVMKVVAHAAPPMTPTPGFRQYDLYIDGQSFFTMPKAYELGIRGPISSHARVPGAYGQGGYGGYGGPAVSASGVRAPTSREQEDADLQRAISASLQESRQFLASKEQSDDRGALTAPPAPAAAAAAGNGDLMDFAGQQGASQPAISDSQTVMSYNSMPPTYGAAPTPQYAAQPPPNPYHPAPAYGAQPQPPAAAAPYQSPHPASNALVLSGAHSNPYATAPPLQPQAPAAPAYGAPPPAATPAYAAAPVQPAAPAFGAPPNVYGGAPLSQPGAVPTGDLFAPPQADPFAPAPVAAPANDPFGFSQPQPMPPTDDPFAPKAPPPPSRDDINSTILSAYGAQGQPHPGHPVHPGMPGQPGQQMPMANGHGQVPNGMAQPTHGLSMHGGYHTVPVAPPKPEKPLSEMEKAMKKLVNIERIDEPAEKDYEVAIKKKEEEQKGKEGRSKGLPPLANQLVGSNATLSQIQEVKPNTPKTGEGVMNAPTQLFHPDAIHAGALVVHGQGPPPIQRGFGVGYGAPPPNFQHQRW